MCFASGGGILTGNDAVIFQSGTQHAMERQRKLVREQLFSEQLHLTKSSLIYQSVSRLISPDLGEPQKILSDPHLLLFLGGGSNISPCSPGCPESCYVYHPGLELSTAGINRVHHYA